MYAVMLCPICLLMQAFFDPLQGFCNAILFIFMSKVIIRRLFSLLRSRLRLPVNACQEVYTEKLKRCMNAADEREPLIQHESDSLIES